MSQEKQSEKKPAAPEPGCADATEDGFVQDSFPCEPKLSEQGLGSHITRRGLVIGAAGLGAMIAVGGVGRAFAGDGSIVRPPGAQDEARFLGLCIKCDRCRSACPKGAIGVGHLEDGIANARTPVMNFDRGYCDFCEGLDGFRCVLNCPTAAIAPGFDPQTDMMGVAVVDTTQCLLYRSAAAKCSKECIQFCPYNAVWQNEAGGLTVDTKACNGCGICHYMCPSASYGSYTGSDLRGINIESVQGGNV